MPPADDKRKAARETIDILNEISTLLNTQLDRHTLSYCVSLIENGVNPEALATVVMELRAQNEAQKQ
ncbi:probable Mitotic-spindle organizing protein 1 [Ramularia collo-cygni]|uniref:Mitotic-spindle organizing protein 1 n=1 Tax=Ramularia collo-cygni TaxID=112498 RepID=A0A2D3VH14_9PEZI|nr:probable Mitotic-spindle organizing protein 1 [Ramularia collo-cygni]CZT24562.1 probable Mitotic-spindle organizing protein 1 [Ramularia collo-cygni]